MKSRERYQSLFVFYAERYSVDPLHLEAQGMAESGLDPAARSHVGAEGLMQFMPPTFKEWSTNLKIRHADPRNPEHSIWCAAAYMGWLLTRCRQGDEPLTDPINYRRAWAAYNWGIGRFEKLHAAHPDDWFGLLPKETSDYIKRIESFLA